MAENDAFDDPFRETDDSLLSIAPGVFDSSGPDVVRTGATNARASKPGIVAAWQSTSRERQVNLIAAIAAVLVVLLVVPAVISVIGTSRREALAAEQAEESQINITIVSAEMSDAEASVSVVRGAFAMSSAFTPEQEREEMSARLDDMSAAVSENDEQKAREAAEKAREYFVDSYAPALVGNVETLEGEWYGASWSTLSDVDDVVEDVTSNLSIDTIDALGSAVIELANLLGIMREEHYESLTTYVPPVVEETQEPQPQQTERPEETEAPVQTEEPAPPETTVENDPEGTDDSSGSGDSDTGTGENGDADAGGPGGADSDANGGSGSDGGGDSSGETDGPGSGFGGR